MEILQVLLQRHEDSQLNVIGILELFSIFELYEGEKNNIVIETGAIRNIIRRRSV
jgi:hypothetical protein